MECPLKENIGQPRQCTCWFPLNDWKTLTMMSQVKRLIILILEWTGYYLLKRPDLEALQRQKNELNRVTEALQVPTEQLIPEIVRLNAGLIGQDKWPESSFDDNWHQPKYIGYLGYKVNFQTPEYKRAKRGEPYPDSLDEKIDQAVDYMGGFINLDNAKGKIVLRQAYDFLKKNHFHSAYEVIKQLDELPASPAFMQDFFENYLDSSIDYVNRQHRAVSKNIPPIAIFAYPKSGSSFLTRLFCEGLDIPQASISKIHTYAIYPWVASLGRGGVVTHAHLPPYASNLSMVSGFINRAVVHTRDPRQVVVSLCNHLDEMANANGAELTREQHEYNAMDFEQQVDVITERVGRHYLPWLQGWMEASERGPLEIMLTSYEHMNDDKEGFVVDLCEYFKLGDNHTSDVLNALENLDDGKGGYNYRLAESREWERVITQAQAERIRSLFPDKVWSLFEA